MRPSAKKLSDFQNFLSTLTDPYEIPERVVDRAAEAFGTAAALLLLDIDGVHLDPTAIRPVPSREVPLLDVHEPIFNRVTFERRTTAIGREEWSGFVPLDGAYLAAAPVTAGGEIIGVIMIGGPETFGAETLSALSTVGAQVGAALRTAERCSDDIWKARRHARPSIAAQMQLELLPPRELYTSGVGVCGGMKPSYEVGGDWHDYALGGRKLFVSVGDPSAVGLNAEATAAIAFGSARNARRDEEDLPEIMSIVTRAINETRSKEGYATLLLAEIDLSTLEMRLISAGHPAPVLIPADTTRPAALVRMPRTFAPLGALRDDEEPGYRVETYALKPGSKLLFYTDGVTNREDAARNRLGTEGLLRLASGLRQHYSRAFVHDFLQEVADYGEGPMLDDATAVLVHLEDTG